MKTLDGETIVWQGHPSWKAMILFYVKWILISLIPLAISVGIHAGGGHTGAWWFSLVTVIDAPGIAAPLASLTIPVTTPLPLWAAAAAGTLMMTASAASLIHCAETMHSSPVRGHMDAQDINSD